MTVSNLGFAVDSSRAVTAAADLDKLVVSAGKAEQGAQSVGRASQQMSAALGSITAILTNIERHTGLMAAGMGQAATATVGLGTAANNAAGQFSKLDGSVDAAIREMVELRGASTGAAAAINQEAVALRALNEEMRQNASLPRPSSGPHGAPGASGGQNNFNTANVAAQFQDIGVTAAMGMSPLQIALQQGTQLSAVLGGQGLTGVVKTLGGAFAAILSPVSLLTIGAVALSAVALQAFGSMFKGAESASDALETHNEWLDKTLAGYDKVRDAAEEALLSALKLPEASATSDLGAQRADAANSAVAAMTRAMELRKEFEGYASYAEAFNVPADVTASLQSVNDIISEITADGALSRQELDRMHAALTELGNSTADQNIKSISAEALVLVDAARQAVAQVDSLDAALRSIPRDIQIKISMGVEYGSALGDLQGLYQDPRSRFDQMREQAKNAADQAQATAVSYGQAVGAGAEFERVMASIDAAEAKANEKSSHAGSKAAAKAAAKPFNQWESATANFQQRIDQARMETGLLGETTYEITRQQAAFDLLNQAKDAGIPITSTVTDQINSMSAEYASATVEMERMAAQQRAMDEEMAFYKGTFSSFFTSFAQGIRNGESAWESFGNAATSALDRIADRALSMAADGLFDMLFGAVMGGIGGGFGGNPMSLGAGGAGFLGGGASAWGPTFAGGGYTGSGPRSGGIDGMGGFPAILHPQETVIDHTRRAANQNQANDNRSTRGPLNITINGTGLSQEQVTAAIGDALDHYDRFQAPQTFNRVQNDPMARG